MSNCAINWFQLIGSGASLQAAADHLSLAPPAEECHAFEFDLPGWYDGSAWHVADDLATRFPDLAVRYEFRPEFDNFALHGVGVWEGGAALYRAPLEIVDSCCYSTPTTQGAQHTIPLMRRTEALTRAACHFPLQHHFETIRRIPAGSDGWRILESYPPHEFSAIHLPDVGATGEVVVLYPEARRAMLFQGVNAVGAFEVNRALQTDEVLTLTCLPGWAVEQWTFANGIAG